MKTRFPIQNLAALATAVTLIATACGSAATTRPAGARGSGWPGSRALPAEPAAAGAAEPASAIGRDTDAPWLRVRGQRERFAAFHENPTAVPKLMPPRFVGQS